nr:DUF3046 domain-containing protein [Phytoactinopolyspora mesophila]
MTDFWLRMEHHLGSAYADSWARDYVLDTLGERTVHQALEAGEDTRVVWRAVCEALNLTPAER